MLNIIVPLSDIHLKGQCISMESMQLRIISQPVRLLLFACLKEITRHKINNSERINFMK